MSEDRTAYFKAYNRMRAEKRKPYDKKRREKLKPLLLAQRAKRYERLKKMGLATTPLCKRINFRLGSMIQLVNNYPHSIGKLDKEYLKQIKPKLESTKALVNQWVKQHTQLREQILRNIQNQQEEKTK